MPSVPLGHIPRTQPLRPASSRAERAPGDGPPLVYLTLGTVQNRAPVLPVVASALASMPIRVLVAIGPDGDPGQLAGLSDNVRVETWVDQAEVIEQWAVVVSHAGSDTFLGALAAGRPQLCLPMAADQFRNAEGGRRAGAVLVLEPDEVRPESITRAVTRLLTEQSFTVHACLLGVRGLSSAHHRVTAQFARRRDGRGGGDPPTCRSGRVPRRA